MSFTVSNVQKQFFLTPGHRHHYSLTCTYSLMETDGAVYKVTRQVFSNWHEGDIGRRAGSQMRVVQPQFISRVNLWEKITHGTCKGHAALVLSRVLVRAAPVKVAPPVVNPLVNTINALQIQVKSANQTIALLQQELLKQTQNITSLRQQVTTLQNTIDGLNGRIVTLQAQVKAIPALKQQIEALQTQAINLTYVLSIIRSRLPA